MSENSLLKLQPSVWKAAPNTIHKNMRPQTTRNNFLRLPSQLSQYTTKSIAFSIPQNNSQYFPDQSKITDMGKYICESHAKTQLSNTIRKVFLRNLLMKSITL